MSIEPVTFRQVLGHFPTGVTVVSGIDQNGTAQGITIGSFTSVSLDPPLVGFLPGKGSSTWPAIASSGSFCANVLGADQAELCWRFAKEPAEGESRFEGIDWTAAPSGSPIVPGVVAWIDCDVEDILDAGDHWFVLGRVRAMEHAEAVSDAMVFFRGKVAHVAMPDA
jgi:3-hydroxy-9,10-secoandrosta-1,3,5(10)-triene-9,17-dione monooxygenase reductase component